MSNKRKIEVTNVWTIYGMNDDSTEAETPLATLSRPQDWGDPRWHYEEFVFEWITDDTHWVNHVHCWTDLKRERWQYPELFCPLVVQILQPGTPVQLCGKTHLDADDFWLPEWGPMPEIYDPFEEYEDES